MTPGLRRILDIGLAAIPALVRSQQLLDGTPDLAGLTLDVLPLAAPGLRGNGGKLHAVDGEHLAPDEALLVANHEHLGEVIRDCLAVIGNQRGDGAEVRLAVTAKREENAIAVKARVRRT